MRSLSSVLLTAAAIVATASTAQADVALRNTPASAVHGEQVDLTLVVDRTTYVAYILWYDAAGNLTKFGRTSGRAGAGAIATTVEAPHLVGSYQVYAYAYQGRGFVFSRPASMDVTETTTTPPTPPQPTTTRFEVVIENAGGAGPLAPGAYALHRGNANPIFRTNSRASAGLEAMAEDGDPSGLERELMSRQGVDMAGVFNTPRGANMPGPAMPGNAYRFVVEADPRTNPRLSLATMLAQTNDAFVAPTGGPIALFDAQGNPLAARTLTVTAYDAGTEANQAFGSGADQAPRQAGPNTGGAESTVRPFTDSTRALPQAQKVVRVSVRRSNGAVQITLENVSAREGAIVSPVTPVFHAVHNGRFSIFTTGQPAPANGLEALAEDGDASQLVASAQQRQSVSSVAAAGNGPIMPGSSVRFTIQPGSGATHLTLATMIARTNDAFIAAQGVALFDDAGRLRSSREMTTAINAALAVYDAGTEANEAPGVGPNIAPLQAGPNTGPADRDRNVRLYADATNDLDGFAGLSVRHLGQGRFEVRISNTSAGTAYPGFLTTPVVLTHTENSNPLNLGGRASAGLAELAKDGGTRDWVRELSRSNAVGQVGTARSDGNGGFVMTVQASATHRFLNLATMVVPSNDAVFALGQGIQLMTRSGRIRNSSSIRADIARSFMAFDAGAELNQAGGAGPAQPPAVHNAGPREGSGRVRAYADPVWSLPSLNGITVTIRPLN